ARRTYGATGSRRNQNFGTPLLLGVIARFKRAIQYPLHGQWCESHAQCGGYWIANRNRMLPISIILVSAEVGQARLRSSRAMTPEGSLFDTLPHKSFGG